MAFRAVSLSTSAAVVCINQVDCSVGADVLPGFSPSCSAVWGKQFSLCCSHEVFCTLHVVEATKPPPGEWNETFQERNRQPHNIACFSCRAYNSGSSIRNMCGTSVLCSDGDTAVACILSQESTVSFVCSFPSREKHRDEEDWYEPSKQGGYGLS